jgi:hypothetical protein
MIDKVLTAKSQNHKEGVLNKYKLALGLTILPFLLWSCGGSEKIPDVKNIKIELQSQRLDKDLAALDTNKLPQELLTLKAKYPDFLDFYLDTLMGFGIMGNYADTSKAIQLGLRGFLSQKDYRGVFDTVAVHFPDTKDEETALIDGFRFMKYYYPGYKVPKIIYVVSGLANWGAFTIGSNTLGIGLDMFLGPSYPFYKSVDLPDYMGKHFTPNYIPVAAFSAIYQDEHPFYAENRSLLDMIIQKGKQQYFVSKILPYTPDSVRFAYTQKQIEWCQNNEAEVYNFFIRENLFYSKDWERVLRYVNEGPNSTGMPGQSPGNIGSWLGMQIVKAYMKQHPETSLQQLLSLNIEPQLFLEQSKYKPK